MKYALVALALLFSFSTPALAATPEEDQVQQLRTIEGNIVALERVQALADEAHRPWIQAAVNRELEVASRLAGQEIANKGQLEFFLKQHDKSGGFFTFLNVVWFLASLVVVIALCWLCFSYFGPYSIEILGYVLCVFGLVSGAIWPSIGIWFVVPACFLLIGLLALTHGLHFKGDKNRNNWEEQQLRPGSGWLNFSFYQAQAAICTVVYGVAAIYYQSTVLGFFTVLALESLLGFTVVVAPFCIGLGFPSDNVIPRATFASFLILAVSLFAKIGGYDAGPFTVFQPGAFFVGTFVYFLGLLITSSWYYYAWGRSKERMNSFWAMQVLTLLSGGAALYIGSVFGIGALLGVGGTFFVIYLLEKYTELPWNEIGFAWGLLGAGLLLFGFALFAYHHPQYFFLG